LLSLRFLQSSGDDVCQVSACEKIPKEGFVKIFDKETAIAMAWVMAMVTPPIYLALTTKPSDEFRLLIAIPICLFILVAEYIWADITER